MRIRRTPTLPAGSQTGLDLQLVVKCPGCSARLTLEEGARAVRCAGCRQPYLVPPWQYPFAAVVNPSIDTVEARRVARSYLRAGQHRATAVGRGQWRLLPFWRHRSAAFQWLSGERHGTGATRAQSAEREATGSDDAPRTSKSEFHDLAVQRLDLLFPAAAGERSPEGYQPPWGMHAAYPLDPAVTVGATLEPVRVDFAAARESAREEVERRCAAGDRSHVRRRRMTLVGEEMVLIYLPFFMLDYQFRDQVHEVIVDGVAGAVVTHRLVPGPDPESGPTGPGAHPGNEAAAANVASNAAPAGGMGSSSAGLASGDARTREAPGQAPLLIHARCPACTATIEPRSPAARVHACDQCGSAWETADGKLRRVDQQLAATEAGAPGARYLPFWKLAVAGDATERPVYVPAFEAWQVERLSHLGVHLTRAEPSYELSTPSGKSGQSSPVAPVFAIAVSLGRDDAERLAWVVLGSIASASPQAFEGFLASGGIAVRAASLVWLPFRPSGLYLRENVSGAIIRDLPVEVEMPVLESDAWTTTADQADQRASGPNWPSAA